MPVRRIGLIGYGAIARIAVDSIRRHGWNVQVCGLLLRRGRTPATATPDGCRVVDSIEDLIELAPDGIFECASHEAVRENAARVLQGGRDLSVISVGALADEPFLDELRRTAVAADATLTILPGALGGIDALAAARVGGLDRVAHTVIKPPAAWKGTEAQSHVELDRLAARHTFFEGPAVTAARHYPKNANATAAVALAGLGLSATTTLLVADPGAERNVHVVDASGAFGTMRVEMCGCPLEDSPKTSMLAALSVTRAIAGTAAGIKI